VVWNHHLTIMIHVWKPTIIIDRALGNKCLQNVGQRVERKTVDLSRRKPQQRRIPDRKVMAAPLLGHAIPDYPHHQRRRVENQHQKNILVSQGRIEK
jgi:hypothetical protein